MLAAQALINAIVFGFLAFGFLPRGPFSRAFLTFVALTILFTVSAIVAKTYGRWMLICTWLIAIALLMPSLPGGMMDGLFFSVWIIAYLIAGLIGAVFLPVRDSPTPGAPP